MEYGFTPYIKFTQFTEEKVMSKKATIKKVDDSSWLVIDQQRGNVGVLYQNVQGTYEYLSNEIMYFINYQYLIIKW